jgi:hypothetical protein
MNAIANPASGARSIGEASRRVGFMDVIVLVRDEPAV